jgi:hypothetical protein
MRKYLACCYCGFSLNELILYPKFPFTLGRDGEFEEVVFIILLL